MKIINGTKGVSGYLMKQRDAAAPVSFCINDCKGVFLPSTGPQPQAANDDGQTKASDRVIHGVIHRTLGDGRVVHLDTTNICVGTGKSNITRHLTGNNQPQPYSAAGKRQIGRRTTSKANPLPKLFSGLFGRV